MHRDVDDRRSIVRKGRGRNFGWFATMNWIVSAPQSATTSADAGAATARLLTMIVLANAAQEDPGSSCAISCDWSEAHQLPDSCEIEETSRIGAEERTGHVSRHGDSGDGT